jgi:hypothetical protein
MSQILGRAKKQYSTTVGIEKKLIEIFSILNYRYKIHAVRSGSKRGPV